MKCPKCGRDLNPGAKFCGGCGFMKADAHTETNPPTIPPDRREPAVRVRTEPPRPIGATGARVKMPQGIDLGVDERVVKQYRIGEYSFRQGYIDVIVTNKRVIRFEESSWLGMQNNQIDEVNLDAVHGTSTTMVRSISILGIAGAAALVILAIVLFAINGSSYRSSGTMVLMALAALAIAAFILMRSFRPTLLFGLLGSVGGSCLQTNVNVRGRIFGQNNQSVVFQFKPTPQVTVMLKEIGALIYDLKTLGDKAISKWS